MSWLLTRWRALVAQLDLRGRVTLATAGVLALGLLGLTLGTLLFLNHQLDHDASTILRERADAQLAKVAARGAGVVLRSSADVEPLDQQGWVYVDGRALRRPSAPARVQRSADSLANVPRTREVAVGGDVLLLGEPAYAADGRRRIATVVVSISLEPYEHTRHLVLVAMVLLDVCILAFGALLARRAVGRALRPVANMTRQAAEWSERDLDRRFDLGSPRDELTGLSATLDRLLARIATTLRHEQRFSAEMAHELRTPLSGLRGEAELALRAEGTPQDVREALEQIVRGADRMQAVIDTLLVAARGGNEHTIGASDARAAAAEAIEAMRPLAQRAGVELTLAEAAVEVASGGAGGGVRGSTRNGALPRVGAEPRLVVQALAPLLDNALRHARGRVTVTLTQSHGEVLVRVEDDGAGIAPEEVERIFEPGASSAGGAGLGLPLARRLARSCGGDVTAIAAQGPATAGGRVVLHLPAVT
jgi:two-component system OmpR family sensor kinase